jgi:hypothetical protein
VFITNSKRKKKKFSFLLPANKHYGLSVMFVQKKKKKDNTYFLISNTEEEKKNVSTLSPPISYERKKG